MKQKVLYPALLRSTDEGTVEVRYPDFPSCGGNVQEDAAINEAQKMLKEYLTETFAMQCLPMPSQLAQIELAGEESLIFIALELP